MLLKQIQDEIKVAMKSGESLKVSTLRLLANALHNEEINKQRSLSEDEEIAIVKRQVKQREESIEALHAAQGKQTISSPEEIANRIIQETAEAEILKVYLPEQMSEAEIEEIVSKSISELGDVKDFGKVMQLVVSHTKGKADGKVVSEIVKAKLIG